MRRPGWKPIGSPGILLLAVVLTIQGDLVPQPEETV